MNECLEMQIFLFGCIVLAILEIICHINQITIIVYKKRWQDILDDSGTQTSFVDLLNRNLITHKIDKVCVKQIKLGWQYKIGLWLVYQFIQSRLKLSC
eukprot:TRINITY_DN16632_c0_g1_i4.p3 TRINITY_DN16632_c0_g1~~TRINITY_DN16632_c0_g1_i4.p3  ORF type:complete len:114 (-),score=0.33 TRINITY_DN16632_c0_g1_i4:413-706(-)